MSIFILLLIYLIMDIFPNRCTSSTQQNPEHTYSAAGTYTVNLSVSNAYGTNSKLAAITVLAQPVLPEADFSSNVTQGYASLTVQFTDLSKNAAQWNWDFGDGTYSTEQNPMHTYSAAGTYTVNLMISNANGTDSKFATITVLRKPILPAADFSTDVTSGYAPLSVQFTDLSQNAASWYWNFGDGAVSTEPNPVHTYSSAGSYTVTQTVNNADGTNSKYATITVLRKPILPAADFSTDVTSGYAPFSVQFTDLSQNAASWYWDFGDGAVSAEPNPVHTYSSAGSYTVTQTVSNADGANSKFVTIYVLERPIIPVADYSTSAISGYAPLSVQFTDISQFAASRSWDFNSDGITDSSILSPIYTYTVPGTYTASLMVSNANGTNSKTAAITVLRPKLPVASFISNVTSEYTPSSVAFTDTSSGSPTSWYWNFGDGTYSSQQNPVHAYNKAGKYTVNLIVANAAGSNTATKPNCITVTAPKPPVSSFSSNVTSGNMPLSVAFIDKSTGSPTSWYWDFGDGANSTGQNPVHAYNKAGKYTVTLKVSNTAGSNTMRKTGFITVTAPKPPAAAFTANRVSGKAQLTVTFNDTSSGTPTSWNWSFGDGTQNSTTRNPVHTYSKAGKYTVSLTATNAIGRNTATKRGYITVSK